MVMKISNTKYGDEIIMNWVKVNQNDSHLPKPQTIIYNIEKSINIRVS